MCSVLPFVSSGGTKTVPSVRHWHPSKGVSGGKCGGLRTSSLDPSSSRKFQKWPHVTNMESLYLKYWLYGICLKFFLWARRGELGTNGRQAYIPTIKYMSYKLRYCVQGAITVLKLKVKGEMFQIEGLIFGGSDFYMCKSIWSCFTVITTKGLFIKQWQMNVQNNAEKATLCLLLMLLLLHGASVIPFTNIY